MASFGSRTPKRHVGWSNSSRVGVLHSGKLKFDYKNPKYKANKTTRATVSKTTGKKQFTGRKKQLVDSGCLACWKPSFFHDPESGDIFIGILHQRPHNHVSSFASKMNPNNIIQMDNYFKVSTWAYILKICWMSTCSIVSEALPLSLWSSSSSVFAHSEGWCHPWFPRHPARLQSPPMLCWPIIFWLVGGCCSFWCCALPTW